jgi:hypothetical protein
MKRIIASLVISVSAFSGQAFALVGGPFDMGSHGANLDRNSVYQAALSFQNGSGFVYFSPIARLVPERVPGGGSAVDDFDSQGSVPNSTVLYYKGVSYVGSCFGTADMEDRFIEGVINGNSDVGFSASSTTSNGGGTSTASSTVSATVVYSGKGYVVNGNFLAKVSQTAPVLRFKGKGELSFLSPTGASSVNTLAYEAYSGLINAIISFVGNSTVGNGNAVNYGLIFTGAQTAIDSALASLKTNYLSTGGVDETYDEADLVKLRVYGTRRYL